VFLFIACLLIVVSFPAAVADQQRYHVVRRCEDQQQQGEQYRADHPRPAVWMPS
jgi:hypothetical protein